MDALAREVCMGAGSDVIMGQESVGDILVLLRDFYAPGSADSIYKEVVRPPQS